MHKDEVTKNWIKVVLSFVCKIWTNLHQAWTKTLTGTQTLAPIFMAEWEQIPEKTGLKSAEKEQLESTRFL